MKRLVAVSILTILPIVTGTASGQSLQEQLRAVGNGRLELVFASRAESCGDGYNFIHDGFGGDQWTDGNVFISGSGRRPRICERGPVRVVAYVYDGELSRLRTFVGPMPAATDDARRITLSVHDAVVFLSDQMEHATGRMATDAMLPLALADTTPPWRSYARVGRDDARSRAVHTQAGFWLSRFATARLGLLDGEESDDDEVRAQAVFAISQQPHDRSVPALIGVAKGSAPASVRAKALFWLGQTADPRAIDYLASVLEQLR